MKQTTSFSQLFFSVTYLKNNKILQLKSIFFDIIYHIIQSFNKAFRNGASIPAVALSQLGRRSVRFQIIA